jgi:OOP family OmpA-OmpF porin
MTLDCKPSKWLWGLLPLVFVTALALVGVRGQIERDLTDRTSAILQDKGLSWAFVNFEGRDAILEGVSFSRSERDAALQAIENVWGVHAIIDRSNLIASPETYTWWARKEQDEKIKLGGHVPTNDDRQAILGFVKAAMPELKLSDKMVLAGGSPSRQVWLGSVSFALAQLGQLKSGTIRLSGTDLVIAGEAKTTVAYQALKTALSTQLPTGVTLKAESISPPLVKPFSWRAKYVGGTISLTGHVPSEEIHTQILDRTRKLFRGNKVVDAMKLASGAPDGWLWAVSVSLTQLHRLESGRVNMKSSALEIEGVAVDKFTAKDVAASIHHGLPSSYRSTESISVNKPKKNDGPSGKNQNGGQDRRQINPIPKAQ